MDQELQQQPNPQSQELPLSSPEENENLNWTVQNLVGGIKDVLYTGSEANARAEFEKRKGSVRSGQLVLMSPDSGQPILQTMRPAFRPTVTAKEGADEDSPPIVSVQPPDLSRVREYVEPGALPEETTDAPAAEKPKRVERLPSAAEAERMHQEMVSGRAAFGESAQFLRDLEVLDSTIRSLELALPLLRKHREALIREIADSQTHEGTQILLDRALQGLRAVVG